MCYYKCCNKVIRVFLTFIDHETESREGENYILQVFNFLWPKKFKIYIYIFLHVTYRSMETEDTNTWTLIWNQLPASIRNIHNLEYIELNVNQIKYSN